MKCKHNFEKSAGSKVFIFKIILKWKIKKSIQISRLRKYVETYEMKINQLQEQIVSKERQLEQNVSFIKNYGFYQTKCWMPVRIGCPSWIWAIRTNEIISTLRMTSLFLHFKENTYFTIWFRVRLNTCPSPRVNLTVRLSERENWCG